MAKRQKVSELSKIMAKNQKIENSIDETMARLQQIYKQSQLQSQPQPKKITLEILTEIVLMVVANIGQWIVAFSGMGNTYLHGFLFGLFTGIFFVSFISLIFTLMRDRIDNDDDDY